MGILRFPFILIWLGVGAGVGSTQPAGEPPKALIEYVRDAQRQGIKETTIKQNAVAAGWPASAVDAAITAASKPPEKENKSGTESMRSAGSDPAPEAAGAPSRGRPGLTLTPPSGTRSAPAADATIPETQKDRGVPDDYRIGAGDLLTISVWKEPDASVPSAVVRTDGKISMPLLKEVEVAGLTPTQVEKTITAKLSKLINGADVTVVVTAINSKKVYVVGAVRREGPIAFTYRMSVMQAISEAGGLTDYAKRKKIYVLRTENGKEYRIAFNYDQVIRGSNPEQNIELLPGDTLVIPH